MGRPHKAGKPGDRERPAYARRMPTWDTVCELGSELPEVEVGTWYGTPALKVRGKGFARLRDDGALV